MAVAAFTGARRDEILALRWSDLDPVNKTLRIERAVEETDKHGLRIKVPKTERGKRTITIDDDLIALLLREREKHLRIEAGIPDRAGPVDLSLVSLPPDALMFPNPPSGAALSFTKLRQPRGLTKEFARQQRLSDSVACVSTICAGATRPRCLTRACQYMSLPHAVAMIQPCCCAAMPSAPRKQTPVRRRSSAHYRAEPCASGVWVQVGSKRRNVFDVFLLEGMLSD